MIFAIFVFLYFAGMTMFSIVFDQALEMKTKEAIESVKYRKVISMFWFALAIAMWAAWLKELFSHLPKDPTP